MPNTLDTINAFRALLRSAPGELDACIVERDLCEQAFFDIYHYAGMKKRTRAVQRKTQDLIKEWTKRRWDAKNKIKELQAIVDFANKNKYVLIELDTVAGKTKKQVEFIEGDKTYKPRVIMGLFSE
jgi:hypothetical protein